MAICRILRSKADHPDLAEEYRSWVDNHPTDFAAVSDLVLELAVFLHDEESAIDAWRDYVSQSPPPSTGATALNALGLLLFERRGYPQAVAELLTATQLNPDAPQFHHDLGRALEATGDLNGALQEYRGESYLAPS